MQILGISGSLRAGSTNTSLLNAAAALAPKNIDFLIHRGLGDLPHFNPDLDHEPLPAAVKGFRFQLLQSAGVIISSPEYAHGVPGVLKNALNGSSPVESCTKSPWRSSLLRRAQLMRMRL